MELFQLLRDGVPRTRAQLAKSTGLARSTIAARVEELVLGQSDPAVLSGWRRGAIGERLLALARAPAAQPPAARRNSE